ncbi:MAG: 4-(cytidine 5'-diphospho)-2-C-methyl-D-erythritol kinase [Gemmataceae bacterium]
MRVRCPAKVNLFLEVTGRRPDGYHDLATLMVSVDLCDHQEMRADPSGEIRLTTDAPGLSTGPDNLICRAAEILRRRCGIQQGVAIRLQKRIPMEAGLGGGSSDAAGALAGLNELWELNLGREQLAEMGAELGSDVPFFFYGPAGWCTGRGEMVEPVKMGKSLDLVLATPTVGLSTREVYGSLKRGDGEAARDGKNMREALQKGDIAELAKGLYNRLEEPAMRLCPEAARLRETLLRLNPAGVLLSGSGSTVFALTRDAAEAWQISRALTSRQEVGDGVRVHVVRSCD